jgi:hypothetical protein
MEEDLNLFDEIRAATQLFDSAPGRSDPPPRVGRRRRYRTLSFSKQELPTQEQFEGIFIAARLLANDIKARPDIDLIANGRKRTAFFSHSYKDVCYSLVHSYLRQGDMKHVAAAAENLNPELSGEGYIKISTTLLTEFQDLLHLIVYEKKSFFWFYNKFFQSCADKWEPPTN